MHARRPLMFGLLWLLAVLACTRGPLDQYAGRVTPMGTSFVPPTPQPLPTRATPIAGATPGPAPTLAPLMPGETLLYRVQGADTLEALAIRFNVPLADLLALNGLSTADTLQPEQALLIPARAADTGPGNRLLPDSELVNGPSVARFDIEELVGSYGGYLARHREFVLGSMRTGAEIVALTANRYSVNPRLLLAIIEHQSGWLSNPAPPVDLVYPLGYENSRYEGFYSQLNWVADTLNLGYYGWRQGTLTTLGFPNGEQLRLSPDLNAGTVGMQYFFSRLYNEEQWAVSVGNDGLVGTYRQLYGNPSDRAFIPLIPADLEQPPLQLPFLPGRNWLYVSGPHPAWGITGPWAAIDLAPPSLEAGCVDSSEWVAAPADGLVVQSGDGIVVLDLDGDGFQQTGWVLFFLHVASEDRVQVGEILSQGDRLGHPSCEGGFSTGTHVHMARKYNGEWMAADGLVPMNLSGWVVRNGSRAYEGTMVKFDGEQIVAGEGGAEESGIWLGR